MVFVNSVSETVVSFEAAGLERPEPSVIRGPDNGSCPLVPVSLASF